MRFTVQVAKTKSLYLYIFKPMYFQIANDIKYFCLQSKQQMENKVPNIPVLKKGTVVFE